MGGRRGPGVFRDVRSEPPGRGNRRGRRPSCGALGRRHRPAAREWLFSAKLAQEKLIKASPIPYTIVRSTQFFEFVGGIAESATEGETVRLPPVLMQPIASDDVAAFMADAALAEPLNGTVDCRSRTDPSRRPPAAIPERYRGHTDGDHRSQGPLLRHSVDDQSLTPGDNPRIGPTGFADWLSRSIPQG